MTTISPTRPVPPDQSERVRALDPRGSFLVQAPAGSGKTDLLTRRFLGLLCQVDDPAQIVAITFTKAAAAEMQHRILSELEKAETAPSSDTIDPFSVAALARRATLYSRARGWNLIDLPAQLRISTIDSFCRDIALQEPLLSGLGSTLDIAENPAELYHRAARRTLEQLAQSGPGEPALIPEIERLLLYRDNGWQELENLLVAMLCRRDAWMQNFWLGEFLQDREPDWLFLRQRLERPFIRAISHTLAQLDALFAADPQTLEEALSLARFACDTCGFHRDLAQLADFPCGPYDDARAIEHAVQAYECLRSFLLTADGSFRKSPDKRHGFPTEFPAQKQRFQSLIDRLRGIPNFGDTLASVTGLPPARYSDDEWSIVRAGFTLLHHAAGQLQVAFAESGVVDFIEVAQVAERVLTAPDGFPSDAALRLADGIRHLLVDEFQDTSRRQHQLIRSLIAAWADPEQRSLFVVGDPMQSIYFFRDADAELFPRVRTVGLELNEAESFALDFIPLRANFRTAPALVETLNREFSRIFVADDDSGVTFSAATAARAATPSADPRYTVHLEFVPQTAQERAADPRSSDRKRDTAHLREQAHQKQIREIVSLVRTHLDRAQQARARGEKYRIAILGRTRTALDPIARALREDQIPFRAVDLEQLADRPEVLDALSLARALFNPEDRAAWLGVLRAPWCGLPLADLHALTSADDPQFLARPVPSLLTERIVHLTPRAQESVARLHAACEQALADRAAHPSATLGTWLEQTWRALGGVDCVDPTARANLNLLWACLDRLPNGEPDLLGPGLQAALQSLTAEPDPLAESETGVHLMTIHKSKGLEFEIVIVPELQAGSGRSTGALLSWLERGLATPEDSAEITEFLVAPLPAKGADSGKARKWVDRTRAARERQEMRRILYVAATRAREELHLFARPEFKTDKNGARSLCTPSGTLLETAWPALEPLIQTRFQEWDRSPQPADIVSIAAARDNLIVLPSPPRPAIIRRLPAGYTAPATFSRTVSPDSAINVGEQYERHQGGEKSRALGTAVHLLLEHLAASPSPHGRGDAEPSLRKILPRIQARLRASGWDSEQAASLAAEALAVAAQTSRDKDARWILSPHFQAQSEVRWTGVFDGRVREVRLDRIFKAGPEPHAPGDQCWWIIDYKTAVADAFGPLAVVAMRPRFAPQLEHYARVLRKLHGTDAPIRAGLYYPRIPALDWWVL